MHCFSLLPRGHRADSNTDSDNSAGTFQGETNLPTFQFKGTFTPSFSNSLHSVPMPARTSQYNSNAGLLIDK